jgi:hypothetical protein
MTDVVWTGDRIDAMKKLYDAGLSASQIAAELDCGATRNAVIGKVHRLGWTRRGKQRPKGQTAQRPRRTQRAPNIIAKRETAQERRAHGPTLPSFPVELPADVQRAMPGYQAPRLIPFLDAEPDDCRFICTGDREPPLICGCPKIIVQTTRGPVKAAYCRFHYARTHRANVQEAA